MRHLTTISRGPCRAQLTQEIDFAALTGLIADILTAVSTAVIAKENQEFPSIPIPGEDE